MNTMSISYPEAPPEALRLSSSEFEREARLAMAVKLFDAGRLSFGLRCRQPPA
jgi:predicted HTH domain antitoxin